MKTKPSEQDLQNMGFKKYSTGGLGRTHHIYMSAMKRCQLGKLY